MKAERAREYKSFLLLRSELRNRRQTRDTQFISVADSLLWTDDLPAQFPADADPLGDFLGRSRELQDRRDQLAPKCAGFENR